MFGATSNPIVAEFVLVGQFSVFCVYITLELMIEVVWPKCKM